MFYAPPNSKWRLLSNNGNYLNSSSLCCCCCCFYNIPKKAKYQQQPVKNRKILEKCKLFNGETNSCQKLSVFPKMFQVCTNSQVIRRLFIIIKSFLEVLKHDSNIFRLLVSAKRVDFRIQAYSTLTYRFGLHQLYYHYSLHMCYLPNYTNTQK